MADRSNNTSRQKEEEPGFFRYTDKPGERPEIVPIMDSDKYRKAKEVYDKLVQAKGDFRYPVPEFVMSRDERMVAWMNYDTLQIGLEEKAYDVCQSFGALGTTAMATLLGHELTHYYEKHAWRRGFAAGFQDLDIGVKLDKIRDNVLNETQADYLGGFLAYSAGYEVFDQTPEFMAKVYAAYGFPEELGDNYPSLTDRKTLARRSGERMKQLIVIFDMANWLNAIGAFAEAKLYYRYILREYQSREIYNNLGVLYVREALEKFSEKEFRFRLPLELDLSARSSSREVDLERTRLLQEAVMQFDYAANLDPAYATAYLNKACAYTLLGDLNRAKFFAETEAFQRAAGAGMSKVKSDVEVLLGIIAALDGNEALAEDYFNQAAAKNNSLGTLNRDILHGRSTPPASTQHLPNELIDGVDLLDFAESPAYNDDLSLPITDTISLLQNPQPAADSSRSKIYMHYNASSSLIICIHMTDGNYTGKTAKGIGLDAAEVDIVAQYGEPIRRIESPEGSMLVYANVFFILDGESGLARWATYLQQILG